jgi:hypothetical protein
MSRACGDRVYIYFSVANIYSFIINNVAIRRPFSTGRALTCLQSTMFMCTWLALSNNHIWWHFWMPLILLNMVRVIRSLKPWTWFPKKQTGGFHWAVPATLQRGNRASRPRFTLRRLHDFLKSSNPLFRDEATLFYIFSWLVSSSQEKKPQIEP